MSIKRVLITGGSGFIGTNLLIKCVQDGYDVLNIDLNPPRSNEHISFWKKADITNLHILTDIVKKFNPNYCFHLAAKTDLDGNSIEDYSANTDGVSNIIYALKQCSQLRLVVFASSMLVCEIGYLPKAWDDYCPSTVYGLSKQIGESIVRNVDTRELPWIILRPTSIWGPWFSTPYRDFFELIQRNMYFHPSDVSIKRSYGFVLNTVHQLRLLQDSDGAGFLGKTSYIADYDPVDLLSWAKSIQQNFKSKPIKKLPIFVFKAAAYLGDLLVFFGIKRFPMNSFRLKNMLTNATFSLDELSKFTGRLPYTTIDGVEITCSWISNQPNRSRHDLS